MDTKKIGKLAALLGEGKISEIERDLALELLRDIYMDVKFGEIQSAATALREEKPEEATEAPAPPELPVYGKPVETSRPQNETLTSRQAEERHVILSLYGDAGKGADDATNSDDRIPTGVPTDAPTGVLTGVPSDVPSDAPTEQQPDEELPQTASPATLREAIGVNDRFVIIRDLFGGDAAQYDRAMAQFDAFDTLDDALIHIEATYRWNPASDGAKQLMEQLTSKLN